MRAKKISTKTGPMRILCKSDVTDHLLRSATPYALQTLKRNSEIHMQNMFVRRLHEISINQLYTVVCCGTYKETAKYCHK